MCNRLVQVTMKEEEEKGILFYIFSFFWPLKGKKNKKENYTMQMMSVLRSIIRLAVAAVIF